MQQQLLATQAEQGSLPAFLLEDEPRQGGEARGARELTTVGSSVPMSGKEAAAEPSREAPSTTGPEVPAASARLLAAIAPFLSVHPTGATADCILAYLAGLGGGGPSLQEVVALLARYPDCFATEGESGRWRLVALRPGGEAGRGDSQ
jgi:hypothetical protein